jgi:hypothetical protein
MDEHHSARDQPDLVALQPTDEVPPQVGRWIRGELLVELLRTALAELDLSGVARQHDPRQSVELADGHESHVGRIAARCPCSDSDPASDRRES